MGVHSTLRGGYYCCLAHNVFHVHATMKREIAQQPGRENNCLASALLVTSNVISVSHALQ